MYQRMRLIPIYTVVVLDSMIMILMFNLANLLRFHQLHVVADNTNYMDMMLLILLSFLFTALVLHMNDNLLQRGKLDEFYVLAKQYIYVGFIVLFYLYLIKAGHYYSRIQLGYFFLFSYVAMGIAHILVKNYFLKRYNDTKECVKMLLVTTSDRLEQVMSGISFTNNWYFHVSYIALLDADRTGECYQDIPIVAGPDNFCEVVQQLPLDAAFIHVDRAIEETRRNLIEVLHQMGIQVHLNIPEYEIGYRQKSFDWIGVYGVVTYRNYDYDFRQQAVKRVMDIVGSVVGLLITGVLSVVIAPAIYLNDPGPILFRQVRIGRNGRRFTIYKFRTMYTDAEQRKKELMSHNEMDGHMFKMKDDPRVTSVGRFLRKTSLDELPQFYNILRGDMSLVGTRPPTEEEFEAYEADHRRRISIKPGLTGLWQVSGRSTITNFEEIVALDCDYIDHWSLWMDVKILLKTIFIVLFQKGAE